MWTLRPSDARGIAEHGWLHARHSFSFAEYHDPAHMGFRALRVINEDRIEAGRGFGTHQHHDMEIITYVLSGALAHKDSMGNQAVIHPGDVQRMTAGSGVSHSEYNAMADAQTHLLQIWLLPNQRGLTPSYEQIHVPKHEKLNALKLIASADGRDHSVTVHQDVSLYSSCLAAGATLQLQQKPGRHLWLQVARGALRLDGTLLKAGDAAHHSSHGTFEVLAVEAAGVETESEFLLFDLA